MSLNAPLRDDMNQRESKFIGRLSVRNLVCGAISVLFILGTVGITMLFNIPHAIASWVSVITGLPPLFIGFWQPANGMKPEEYLLNLILHNFGQRVWLYESESPWLHDLENHLQVSLVKDLVSSEKKQGRKRLAGKKADK